MKDQKINPPDKVSEKQIGYHSNPHPPKEFTQKVVLKAAKKFAEPNPYIFAVGWRWKTRKDREPVAIVGFFIHRRKSKANATPAPLIPKEINLSELFEGVPTDFYGLTTVQTRLMYVRSVCKLGSKKKKLKKKVVGAKSVVPAFPILQPGEIIYHPNMNTTGTICALINKEDTAGRKIAHILSAMHVLADGSAATATDSVFQPDGNSSLKKVGQLSHVGQSEGIPLENRNDYALSKVTTSRQRRSEIKGLGQPSAAVDTILTNQTVAKSGTSSGVTYGVVYYTTVAFSSDSDHSFNPDVFGFIIVSLHVSPPELFERFATWGDSGSIVAVIDNGAIRPAGMLVSLSQIDGLGPGFIALSLTDIVRKVGGELHT